MNINNHKIICKWLRSVVKTKQLQVQIQIQMQNSKYRNKYRYICLSAWISTACWLNLRHFQVTKWVQSLFQNVFIEFFLNYSMSSQKIAQNKKFQHVKFQHAKLPSNAFLSTPWPRSSKILLCEAYFEDSASKTPLFVFMYPSWDLSNKYADKPGILNLI